MWLWTAKNKQTLVFWWKLAAHASGYFGYLIVVNEKKNCDILRQLSVDMATWQGTTIYLQLPGGLYRMRGKLNIFNMVLPSNLTCIWHCVGAHSISSNGRGEEKSEHDFWRGTNWCKIHHQSGWGIHQNHIMRWLGSHPKCKLPLKKKSNDHGQCPCLILEKNHRPTRRCLWNVTRSVRFPSERC